jgi:hypothetical protein
MSDSQSSKDLARSATWVFVRAAATAAGAGVIHVVVWWITHR